jgi:hypothetical protein
VDRQADNFVNWQERASEFQVGDVVVPFGMLDSQAGRVTAVWPAIGMIDVEMPTGNKRWPAEDLQRFNPEEVSVLPTRTDSTAGGQPTVSVPGGPHALRPEVGRVANAYVKQALYWAQKDRQYKMTQAEMDCGKPCCPRCEGSPPLKKAIYKRRDGSSDRLLGCPGCMFLIKESDIMNGPNAYAVTEGAEGEL